ncbi:MAG: hypothetical protein E6H07_03205 [Bacteroidetes bacterium]|nr:MAG: hypothetical protein E6H07_03205 [Bacteroidota bacterium]
MRVLLIADPGRPDFFEYLISANSSVKSWEIIWEYKYSGKTEQKEFLVVSNGKTVPIHYWSDLATPNVLFRKIDPDKIIFFEIIDLWQISLVIAAQKKKITTFFVEHGVGNSVEQVINRFNERLNLNDWFKKYKIKIIRYGFRAIKNRIFYFSQIFNLNSFKSFFKYLFLPVNLKRDTPIHCLSKNLFRERTPNYAILFNRNNVAPFLVYNIIEKKNIITEGVPFFDEYYRGQIIEEEYVFFVEHPYLEEGILEWNDIFHEKIARTLEEFAIKNNIPVYIKLHPRSKIENWTRYNLNANLITLLQKENVVKLMLEAKLILGYSSTLLNIMIQCKKNVVLLGWHPKPRIFGDDYSVWNLCHKSYEITDIHAEYRYWIENNLCDKDSESYKGFLEEYNYPFDGKATERVLEAIQTL